MILILQLRPERLSYLANEHSQQAAQQKFKHLSLLEPIC